MEASKIKKLRDQTGLSMMLCKQALEETGGEEEKAVVWLRQKGVEFAEKKSSRATAAGIVESYIHSNGRIGVLLELKSETDFVARNPDFREFGHNLAMQIAASDPADIEVLLEQIYVKNPGVTVADYLNETIQKFGEKIEVSRFERFAL